jgi:hypothetical protein
MKLVLAIHLPNLGRMIPLGVAGVVLAETGRIAALQLGGQGHDDRRRHRGGIGQQGPQKPDGPQLHRQPQTRVRGLALGNELMIPVIQVKVAGQLERRRLSRITALTALLVLREKLDRQRSPHGAPRRPLNKPTGLLGQFLMEESACYLTPHLSEKSAQDAFGARRPADQPPEGARR